MSKNIIRIKKRDTPYVIIDKECLNNKNISFRAKGLHSYLISKPDDWVAMMSELVNSASEGRDAVRKAFKELESAGYIKRVPRRGKNGKLLGTDTLVYERVTEALETRISVDDRATGNPSSGKPSDGKTPTTNKVNILNKEEQNSSNKKPLKEKEDSPLPPSPFFEEAKSLATELLSRTEEAIGRKLMSTVKSSTKPIESLLKRGYSATDIHKAIDWLCTKNMEREPMFILQVQSGEALLKKWDKVMAGIDRDKTIIKKTNQKTETVPQDYKFQ